MDIPARSAFLLLDEDPWEPSSAADDDRPRWIDPKRKRVQVFETYYREAGDWWRCVWFRGGILEPAVKSAYVDEDGQTQCCMVAQSLYVGLDGDRYGAVRRYKSLQDEINHRHSKALHILNTRQVVTEKGAVEDVQAARREVAKPDGFVEVTPGMRFDIAQTNDGRRSVPVASWTRPMR